MMYEESFLCKGVGEWII